MFTQEDQESHELFELFERLAREGGNSMETRLYLHGYFEGRWNDMQIGLIDTWHQSWKDIHEMGLLDGKGDKEADLTN